MINCKHVPMFVCAMILWIDLLLQFFLWVVTLVLIALKQWAPVSPEVSCAIILNQTHRKLKPFNGNLRHQVQHNIFHIFVREVKQCQEEKKFHQASRCVTSICTMSSRTARKHVWLNARSSKISIHFIIQWNAKRRNKKEDCCVTAGAPAWCRVRII